MASDWKETMHRKLDGELDAGEERALDARLDRSPELRRDLAELADVRELVAEVGSTERHVPRTPAPLRNRRPSFRVGAGLVAAALTLAMIRLLVPFERGDRLVDPPDASVPSEASVELPDAVDSSALVVEFPAEDPEIHIFWIYPTKS